MLRLLRLRRPVAEPPAPEAAAPVFDPFAIMALHDRRAAGGITDVEYRAKMDALLDGLEPVAA